MNGHPNTEGDKPQGLKLQSPHHLHSWDPETSVLSHQHWGRHLAWFPSGLVVKNPPANAGDSEDLGSVPGLGRSPGGGNGNRLQYSCLGNPMDRRAWPATVHRVAKNRIRLRQLSMHA